MTIQIAWLSENDSLTLVLKALGVWSPDSCLIDCCFVICSCFLIYINLLNDIIIYRLRQTFQVCSSERWSDQWWGHRVTAGCCSSLWNKRSVHLVHAQWKCRRKYTVHRFDSRTANWMVTPYQLHPNASRKNIHGCSSFHMQQRHAASSGGVCHQVTIIITVTCCCRRLIHRVVAFEVPTESLNLGFEKGAEVQVCNSKVVYKVCCKLQPVLETVDRG